MKKTTPSTLRAEEPTFLPKLNLPRSIIRDSSKPHMYVPLHLDVDRKARLQRKRRRGHSVLDFLSSKVDFIDDENNRKLEIQKRRKMQNLMPSSFKKEAVFMPAVSRNNSVRLMSLVEKIYLTEQGRDQGEYVALTNRVVTIGEDQMMRYLPSRIFK